jgi:hypothetical protein
MQQRDHRLRQCHTTSACGLRPHDPHRGCVASRAPLGQTSPFPPGPFRHALSASDRGSVQVFSQGPWLKRMADPIYAWKETNATTRLSWPHNISTAQELIVAVL